MSDNDNIHDFGAFMDHLHSQAEHLFGEVLAEEGIENKFGPFGGPDDELDMAMVRNRMSLLTLAILKLVHDSENNDAWKKSTVEMINVIIAGHNGLIEKLQERDKFLQELVKQTNRHEQAIAKLIDILKPMDMGAPN